MMKLKQVCVNQSQVTISGIEELLRQLPTIERIQLIGTSVAIDDTSLSMLQKSHPACFLNTSHSPHSEDASWVLRLGGNLKAIVDGQDGLTQVGDLTAVPDQPFQIHSINFEGNSLINDAGVNRFTSIKGLKKLSLRDTDVTDAVIGSLGYLTNLEELILTGTNMTAEGIEAVKERMPGCTVVGENNGSYGSSQKKRDIAMDVIV